MFQDPCLFMHGHILNTHLSLSLYINIDAVHIYLLYLYTHKVLTHVIKPNAQFAFTHPLSCRVFSTLKTQVPMEEKVLLTRGMQDLMQTESVLFRNTGHFSLFVGRSAF